MFISVAAGLSCGYEWGTQTTHELEAGAMVTTTGIHRAAVSGEGFLRIGFAFDLSEGNTPVRPH